MGGDDAPSDSHDREWLFIDGREAAHEMLVSFFVEHLRRGRRRWRRPCVWPPDLDSFDAAILCFELKKASVNPDVTSLKAFADEKCRTPQVYRAAYIEAFTSAVHQLDPGLEPYQLKLDVR